MSDVKNLPDYVAKLKAACLPDGSGGDSKNLILGGDHLILILDVMMAMYGALETCVDKHPNSGHQHKTLDIVDKMIREISNATNKRQ